MAIEASRWMSYDEAAAMLGLSSKATMRLAMRWGWSRRAGPAGGMLVAVPEAIPDEEDLDDVDRTGARSVVDFLEAHVGRLTDELAEARTEMRGVRYEAESLRIEASRAQVLTALVEAERARSAEIRAERDRLAAELAEHRRPWLARALWMLFNRPPARRRGRRAF